MNFYLLSSGIVTWIKLIFSSLIYFACYQWKCNKFYTCLLGYNYVCHNSVLRSRNGLIYLTPFTMLDVFIFLILHHPWILFWSSIFSFTSLNCIITQLLSFVLHVMKPLQNYFVFKWQSWPLSFWFYFYIFKYKPLKCAISSLKLETNMNMSF